MIVSLDRPYSPDRSTYLYPGTWSALRTRQRLRTKEGTSMVDDDVCQGIRVTLTALLHNQRFERGTSVSLLPILGGVSVR
jgi:hypothetical protein